MDNFRRNATGATIGVITTQSRFAKTRCSNTVWHFGSAISATAQVLRPTALGSAAYLNQMQDAFSHDLRSLLYRHSPALCANGLHRA